MIDLYGMTSPNVGKVLIMLEELGESYRVRHLNVFRGDQFEPSFQQLSPLSKVPVIVDGDGTLDRQVVFESGAILIYLGEKHARFLPAAGPARHEILQWLMVQLCNIGPIFGQLTHFRRLAPPGNAYSLERYNNLAVRLYRLLESRLAQRRWLAADCYSVADIATYPWLRYVEWHGLDWAEFPNVKRWHEAIGSRPAVERADAQMAQLRPIDAQSMTDASAAQLDRFFGRS
jgi:GST-like protein